MAETTHANRAPKPTVEADRPVSGKSGRWPHWFVELLWLGGTAVACLLVAVWALALWNANLRVPFVTSSDGLLGLGAFKGVIETGWYLHNPSLGAPYGLTTYDFSGFDADNLQWLIVRVLATGTSNAGALLNAYYLLGYPLIGGVTFLVLRGLGISRLLALVGAVVYAALPYHFARGEGHLFLSTYFAVPAAGWLILRTLTREPLVRRREGGGRVTGWLTPLTIGSAAAVIAAGGSTLYYAVFAILLLCMAAVSQLLSERRMRAVLPTLALIFAVGAVLSANIAPAVLYQREHGRNTAVAGRVWYESEIYSTSLTKLLLPVPGHRIGAFDRLQARHQSETLIHGESGVMGLLLSAAFVMLILTLLGRAIRSRAPNEGRDRLIGASGVAALSAFLFATFGGLGEIMAMLVSPQIRAWNRLTPFIAFFALVGLVAFAEGFWQRTKGRGIVVRGLATLAVLGVTVLAIFDQTTPVARPDYAANAAVWQNDGRFVAEIERQLPKGAMVLQLPFHPFPETEPTGHAVDYDLLRGYVHSKGLRWSYGAMKGRPADWTSAAAQRPLATVLRGAAAAGFSGVYVDRWASDDNGQDIEAKLGRTLGVGPSIVSEDARLTFFDMRPLAARQRRSTSSVDRARLARDLLRPVTPTYGGGLFPAESRDGQTWNWLGASGTIELENPRSTSWTAELRATAATSPTTVLTIGAPGVPTRTFRFRRGPRQVRVRFTVPPGKSTVTLAARGPVIGGSDPRDLRVQLLSLRLVGAKPLGQ